MANYDVISKKCNISKRKCISLSMAKIVIENRAGKKFTAFPLLAKRHEGKWDVS